VSHPSNVGTAYVIMGLMVSFFLVTCVLAILGEHLVAFLWNYFSTHLSWK